jgi:hypothetical protein
MKERRGEERRVDVWIHVFFSIIYVVPFVRFICQDPSVYNVMLTPVLTP